MKSASIFRKAGKVIATAPSSLDYLARGMLGLKHCPSLFYITPENDWVTDWVGKYVTSEIKRQFKYPAYQVFRADLLLGQIIHYGEMGAFLSSLGKEYNKRNTVIATIFHGAVDPRFPQLAENVQQFLSHTNQLSKVVTACQIMAVRLSGWGVPSNKILCLPLGIDLDLFKPPSPQQRADARSKVGIPENAVCIGSFHKDGDGWGEGLQPKLIKGPDIFLETLGNLRQQYDLFTLLSAPARGYVKKGLEKLGIPYRHIIQAHYPDIASLYHCLDLYLVTSREEGGPLGVLESLASGIPLVSTSVGMAPDVITHGNNGLLTESEAVNDLVECVSQIITQPELRDRLVKNGLESISQYAWPVIASRYFHELYLPLIKSMENHA